MVRLPIPAYVILPLLSAGAFFACSASDSGGDGTFDSKPGAIGGQRRNAEYLKIRFDTFADDARGLDKQVYVPFYNVSPAARKKPYGHLFFHGLTFT